jgi:hypothetical protein
MSAGSSSLYAGGLMTAATLKAPIQRGDSLGLVAGGAVRCSTEQYQVTHTELALAAVLVCLHFLPLLGC